MSLIPRLSLMGFSQNLKNGEISITKVIALNKILFIFNTLKIQITES